MYSRKHTLLEELLEDCYIYVIPESANDNHAVQNKTKKVIMK